MGSCSRSSKLKGKQETWQLKSGVIAIGSVSLGLLSAVNKGQSTSTGTRFRPGPGRFHLLRAAKLSGYYWARVPAACAPHKRPPHSEVPHTAAPLAATRERLLGKTMKTARPDINCFLKKIRDKPQDHCRWALMIQKSNFIWYWLFLKDK